MRIPERPVVHEEGKTGVIPSQAGDIEVGVPATGIGGEEVEGSEAGGYEGLEGGRGDGAGGRRSDG